MKFRNTTRNACLVGALFLTGIFSAQGQLITLPQNSPHATLTQTVGITDITVDYSRPSVNGREGEIWGALVPYGLQQISFASKGEVPWRAGANENTVVTFSTDVSVEGEALAAGSYGLHMILSEDNTATVIFSENTSSWGSFWYDEAEDVLRVEVKTEEAPFHEMLTFDWVAIQGAEGTLALSWENLRIPIQIGVDIEATVLASMREELRGQTGFSPIGLLQAANWCLQQDTNHEEAIVWATNSAQNQPAFNSYAILGLLYSQNEQLAEGLEAMNKSAELATPPQLNALANRMLPTHPEEAVAYLEQNAKANPDNPAFQASLAAGYVAVGNEKAAIKAYRKVLAMDGAPEPIRANAEQGLKDLGADD